MNLPAKQRGVTALGWMTILALIVFFALVGLKVGPLYMEWGTVSSIVERVSQENQGQRVSRNSFIRSVQNQLDVNSIGSLQAKNILTFERGKGTTEVTVAYQGSAPLFGNLSVVADFSKSFSIAGGS